MASAADPGLEMTLPSAADQEALGGRLAAHCPDRVLIFLRGDLGVGKTTLARGFIRSWGHSGKVKSPTYTLIEPYAGSRGALYHLDLYRLADPGELEFLGVRDLLDQQAALLVEWPERAEAELPPADLDLSLSMLDQGRRAALCAKTDLGRRIVRGLIQQSR